MRRCPDCGFRVKDPEFRNCPLCGVRMLPDPGGQTVQYKLHEHKQKNESCLLPNQQQRPVVQPKKDAGNPRGNRKTPQVSSKTVMAIVFVVLWTLFEACTG